MSNQAASTHLAAHLGQLVWPGNSEHKEALLPLPVFRQGGMSPAVSKHFASEAGLPSPDINRLAAEAIVYALEQGGFTVIATTELAATKAAATPTVETRHRKLTITCNACNNKLFALNVDTERPVASGPHLIEALGTLNPRMPAPTKGCSMTARTLADIQADLTKLQAQIPESMRSQLDTTRLLPPPEKAAMLAMLGSTLQRNLATNPLVQPLNVQLEMHANGWTLTVSMPEPSTHSDIELPPPPT